MNTYADRKYNAGHLGKQDTHVGRKSEHTNRQGALMSKRHTSRKDNKQAGLRSRQDTQAGMIRRPQAAAGGG